MLRVDKKHYNDVIPLLQKTAKTTPTNAWAIVEKYIEGDIYSHVAIKPDAALIGSEDGTYFICGDPSEAFVDTFASFYAARKEKRFTIFSPSTMWDEVIESVMTANTKKMKRKVYTLNIDKFFNEISQEIFSSEFEISSISRTSIMKSSHFNETYYQTNWGSVDQYLKYGIGFCAINKNKEILSACTSIFRSHHKANIDIYTSEEARGKGLALILSREFIVKCLKNGISPIWDCDCTNEPSLNLAEKLGFDQSKEYHLYYKTLK